MLLYLMEYIQRANIRPYRGKQYNHGTHLDRIINGSNKNAFVYNFKRVRDISSRAASNMNNNSISIKIDFMSICDRVTCLTHCAHI